MSDAGAVMGPSGSEPPDRRGLQPVKLHHVALVSADSARLVSFLRDVCGFDHQMRMAIDAAVAERVGGWAPGSLGGPVTAEILSGPGSGTAIEVIGISERAAREVGEGPRLLSFAVADLAALAAKLVEEGVSVEGPQRLDVGPGQIEVALAEVGGTRFEFVRFQGDGGQEQAVVSSGTAKGGS